MALNSHMISPSRALTKPWTTMSFRLSVTLQFWYLKKAMKNLNGATLDLPSNPMQEV